MKTAKSILVVEDDVINRVALCRFLSKQGYAVNPANDGDEALEIYAKNKFDLIIMDLVMPGIDGAETARKMRFTGTDTSHGSGQKKAERLGRQGGVNFRTKLSKKT